MTGSPIYKHNPQIRSGLLKDVGPMEEKLGLAEEARDKAERELKEKAQVMCGGVWAAWGVVG